MNYSLMTTAGVFVRTGRTLGVHNRDTAHEVAGMADLADLRVMLFPASLGISREMRALLDRGLRTWSDAAEAAGRGSDYQVTLVLRVLRGQHHGVSANLAALS